MPTAALAYLANLLWVSAMLYFAGHQPFPLCLLQGAIVTTGLTATRVMAAEVKQHRQHRAVRKSSAA